ncbi:MULTISPECIES: glycerate kinase [Ramlibacter]|uniref:Glycerate kinase n=1 Tax=Ramlibacter pinisoli TaxID=2682844 RepID=A0A6N8IN62_9BURK|nr:MULTISPECIES: glycerate kinase [Ramlibacter]MBA2960675.1 glycerate kinase [Ramlibacter sp. CGMCC 1.13660]MVQ28005.1 glycerate kinase [Ramlibacter pinisoli]
MNFQRILVPLAGVAVAVLAWRAYGWPGVAIALTGIVMWALLHFTRLTQVLKRAGERPIGYCDSAVMLNAKLRPGLTLLHVIGMTRALGEQLSPKDAQPEVYRWTDGSASHVTCDFAHGKLARWELHRPDPGAAGGAGPDR